MSEEERKRRIEEHIKRSVSEAPPLTQEQVDKIARLLSPYLHREQP